MNAPVTTATLRHAVKASGLGGFYLAGQIFQDRLGRWDDGAWIHTSLVLEEVTPGVFRTLAGSVYQVESWSGAESQAA